MAADPRVRASGKVLSGQRSSVGGLDLRVRGPERRWGAPFQFGDQDGEVRVPAGGGADEEVAIVAEPAVNETEPHEVAVRLQLEGHLGFMAVGFGPGMGEDARRLPAGDAAGEVAAVLAVGGVFLRHDLGVVGQGGVVEFEVVDAADARFDLAVGVPESA